MHATPLRWHHRDPTTKFGNIAHLVFAASYARFMNEIAKGDLLCPGCHARRHHAMRRTGVPPRG